MSRLDRLRRPRRTPQPSGRSERTALPTHHLIAISDLHLGADLRRGKNQMGPPALDAPLARLLRRYRRRHHDGRPWRLVVAGDMVDFVGMTLLPEANEPTEFAVSPQERLTGLDATPDKSAWKMRRVLVRHAGFTQALARFLEAGNELVILRGNHDPDWKHEAVRAVFVDEVARQSRRNAAQLRQQIRFGDWFYFEPGRCFIEHGHLHDEYCSDGPLEAAAELQRDAVSTLALRHFANRHDGLDMSAVDAWGFGDFIAWALRRHCFWRALGDYLRMCARLTLLATATATGQIGLRVRRLLSRIQSDPALDGLRRLVAGLEEAPAHLVDEWTRLWKAPAGDRPHLVARLFFIDRAVVLLTALLVCAGLVLGLEKPGPRLAGCVSAMALAAWLDRQLAGRRRVDSHPKLMAVAHRLRTLFDVELVVMGHSHRPIDVAVGEGRYINLGTWLGRPRGGLFPHLVIDHRGPRLVQGEEGTRA
jgi:metallophosphoesterase superfamily enzyme